MIIIEDLSIHYGKKRVLSNIYLQIQAGTVIGVIGPNGAGKSTLFKAILGLTEISSGKISFDQQDIKKLRSKIAYVPQKDLIDWTFPATVEDIVMMGRYAGKKVFQWLNKKDKQLTTEAMEEMDILHLRNRQIGELSGGQQQRVFIARALAQEADFIFLDEPFVGVDIITEEKTVQTLKRLAAMNKLLMVVHHDLSTVESYFDEVLLINQRLIAYGPVRETFTPDNIAKAFGGQLTILQKAGLVHR
jgi:ABC-type Mn2+/Zn2+ transport system ATPase subunit